MILKTDHVVKTVNFNNVHNFCLTCANLNHWKENTENQANVWKTETFV